MMTAQRWISIWRRQVFGRAKSLHPSSPAYSFNSRAFYVLLLRPDLPDVCKIPSATTFCRPNSSEVANEETAQVIDGKSIAKAIRLRIASEVSIMKEAIRMSPRLAFVVLGSRRDSQTFINIKSKACDQVGIATFVKQLPEDSPKDAVLHVVSKLNADPSVHGIIVQLPLPQHLDEERILDVISPEKDVDGFHPLNMGNLALKGKEPLFIPCAPKGCIELLLRSGVKIAGKRAVVIGRSKIGGLPISLLLQRHHATVSTINAFTENPEHITREADIVVADVGVPNMVRGSWLKKGAVVVDMGSNQIKKDSTRSCNSYSIVGDVCYEEAVKVASVITPVPGGLGPVSIAMLLSNTLDAAKRSSSFVSKHQ